MNLKITRIEPQKKRTGRYNIFANEEFLAGVSQETLIKLDLNVGKDLTGTEIKHLKDMESESKLRDQAYRFLSRRAHSRRELHNKLSARGYATGAIIKMLDDLMKRGYINDGEFARTFVEEEIKLKKSGPLLIKSKLQQKGVSREIIEELLSSLYTEHAQLDNCSYLAQKKYGQINTRQKTAAINYLRHKGYNWDHISVAIMQILEENDHE